MLRNVLAILLFSVTFPAITVFGQPTFQGPHEISASYGTMVASWAQDMDGDDILDILFLSTNGIGWCRNEGTGGYEKPVMLVNGAWDPLAASLHDMDNNGLLDLVANCGSDNTLVWFKRLTGAAFDARVIIHQSPMAANSFAVADIDGDGDVDLAGAFQAQVGWDAAWWENLGNGTFAAPVGIISNAVMGVKSIALGDITNDGNVDVVLTQGGRSYGAFNPGGGVLDEVIQLTPFAQGRDLALSDADDDGDLDLFLWYNTGLVMHENLGGGLFGAASSVHASSVPLVNVVFNDVNADGHDDVLLVEEETPVNANIHVLLYDPLAGTWAMPDIVCTDCRVSVGLSIADADEDGHVDILAVDGREIGFMQGGANAQFEEFPLLVVSNSGVPHRTRIADLNGDGAPDILVGGLREVLYYPGDGTVNFGPLAQIDQVSGLILVETFDCGSDGIPEVFGLTGTNMTQYTGMGGGDFEDPVPIATLLDVSNFTTADLDMNGRKDLLFCSYNSPQEAVGWLANNGSGTFVAQSVPISGMNWPVQVRAADLNMDGAPDIVCAAFSPGLSWCANNGIGGFPADPPTVINQTPPYLTEDLEVGDLDGDGDPDIAHAFATNLLRLYFNEGNGTFNSVDITLDFPYIDEMELGDLDGDGDLDIIGSTSAVGGPLIFLNDGSGTFDSPYILPSNSSIGGDVSCADMDGDGDLDILFGATGYLVWYENMASLPLAIGPDPVVGTTIRVVPNPASNTVDLRATGQLMLGAPVILRTLDGSEVRRFRSTGAEHLNIDIQGLAAGAYMLQTRDANGRLIVARVMIQ